MVTNDQIQIRYVCREIGPGCITMRIETVKPLIGLQQIVPESDQCRAAHVPPKR
jgi:hypothetical protein